MQKAFGGVEGTGWTIATHFGFFFPGDPKGRVALSFEGRDPRVNAKDGHLSGKGIGAALRLDKGLVDFGPMLAATGELAGGHTNLKFRPKDSSMDYEGSGGYLYGFGGITLVAPPPGLTLSLGAFAQQDYNDFVGGVGMYGAEARIGFWLAGKPDGRPSSSSDDAPPPADVKVKTDWQSPGAPPAPDSDRYHKELQQQEKRQQDRHCSGGNTAGC